jgi:hypothetical protein
MGTSLWTEVGAATADKPLWLAALITVAAMLIHKGPDYLKVILEHRRFAGRADDEQQRNRIMIEQAIADALARRAPPRRRRRP